MEQDDEPVLSEDETRSFRMLREDQKERVLGLLRALARPTTIKRDEKSDFVTAEFANRFADALVAHHIAAGGPFTKEKFENELVAVLRVTGHPKSEKVPGLRPRDVTVDGQGWSLKTQADAGIEETEIHISKFMELGKGKWETEKDLPGLRDAMLRHMDEYERIFVLRCFLNSRRYSAPGRVRYELVEVPKDLLQRAAKGKFRMQNESKQNPKPGYCTVTDDSGDVLFHLYFDGGTERKLQITHLRKSACRVHATWDLELPK